MRFHFLAALFISFSVKAFVITGRIKLGEGYEKKVFLCKINSVKDFFSISPEWIIAEAAVDSNGNFKIVKEVSSAEKIYYRLHIIQTGDHDASIFVGGKKENFIPLILTNNSKIEINAYSENFTFTCIINGSPECAALKTIRILLGKLYVADQLSIDSGLAFSKDTVIGRDSINKLQHLFYEKTVGPVKKEADLLLEKFALQSPYPLVGIYIAARLNFPFNIKEKKIFYENLDVRFQNEIPESVYAREFHEKMAEQGLVSFSSKLLWFIYPAAALLLVFAGWSFYSQQKLKKIIALLKAAEKERQESKETGTEISELLTRKEGEVYTLLMQNKSNKEIAGALFVEVSTVKTHINNINKKLNPLNRKNIKSSVPVN